MGMHDREVVRLLKGVSSVSGMKGAGRRRPLGYFSLLSAPLAGPVCTVWAFEPSSNMVLTSEREDSGRTASTTRFTWFPRR